MGVPFRFVEYKFAKKGSAINYFQEHSNAVAIHPYGDGWIVVCVEQS